MDCNKSIFIINLRNLELQIPEQLSENYPINARFYLTYNSKNSLNKSQIVQY